MILLYIRVRGTLKGSVYPCSIHMMPWQHKHHLWLVRNQDNVSEWSNMSKCNLSLPWYNWSIDHFVLNNNHSLCNDITLYKGSWYFERISVSLLHTYALTTQTSSLVVITLYKGSILMVCHLVTIKPGIFIADIDITWQLSYKKQELLTLHEHLSSPSFFWWGPCCSSF